MNSKKILFLCPYPENVAPSQRLKFEQYYKYFREAGYEVVTSPFINESFWKIIYKKGNFFKKAFFTITGYFNRIQDLLHARKYDIVYIHLWVTPFGPPFFEWLFNKFSKRIIYDIDDLIYLGNVKSKSHPVVDLVKGRNKPVFLMKHAEHVITCTPYLDNFVKKLNPVSTDISSTIDTDTYLPKQQYAVKDKVIIGWSGSHSTSKYLHLLDNVFKELAATHSFTLLVMGDPEFSLDGVEVEAIPWKEEYEVDTIRHFDIGVYPLPDEEWVLGKSGLKALQYMATGVPTVATAIGTIFRIIDHGNNGFLVSSDEEWLASLKQLISSEELRRKLGSNAVKTVEESYSINANKAKYLSVLSGDSGV
ncbi:MAG: glycosyltransferase family 4 protein [Bacteroidia bacterium]